MVCRRILIQVYVLFRAVRYRRSPAEQIQPNVTSDSGSVPAAVPAAQSAAGQSTEDVKYTLGPDDFINIMVQRHPEFSGDFPINQEGKIQFRFIGDVDVRGLTKKEVEAKIAKLIRRVCSQS
jgi:protein involved in polysaccharide export with SLBB domain